MPATEQTWRDQRLLHRIFGATGFLLLVATVWMFYADHNREWKQYQDRARQMDLTYNEWLQLQYRTDDAVRAHAQLSETLLEAQSQDVPDELLERFAALCADDSEAKSHFDRLNIGELRKGLTAAVAAVDSANGEAQVAARQTAAREREKLIDALNQVVARVRFRETNKLDERKGRSGELDAAKANFDLAVSKNAPNQAELQGVVDQLKAQLDTLTEEYQTLTARRRAMLATVRAMTAGVDDAAKAADASQAELKGLQSAFSDRSMNYFTSQFPWLGKKWLTLPVLDAFNSPRKIENLWSDDLTINYNFRNVRRFDRCTTCHQAIEKTLPGKPDQPLFSNGRNVRFQLSTPTADELKAARDEYAALEKPTVDENRWLLQKLYGLRLSEEGLASSSDVSVSLVVTGGLAANAAPMGEVTATETGSALRAAMAGQPEPVAADALVRPGFLVGDSIREISGSMIDSPAEVARQLLVSATFGKPLEITIHRGFANPYSSHPRLDLFVGSLSPHKVQTFACTICHEGQGSATQFKWASHSPDSSRQREEWSREHGWFDNAHWIYPMYSKRFAEATCLKCHHDVVELAPSPRFPDPPAPKVMHGYNLLRKYGCYGCHEVNGYDGPNRRIGPDLRAEPNFFAAALQLRAALQSGESPAWAKLSAEEQAFVHQVAEHPENDAARHRLVEMLTTDLKAESPRFSSDAHRLAGSLKDVETPGALPKPGPSLRYVASKLDEQFLYDWIREPKHFRPNSRMPQFFGFRAHLADEKSKGLAADFEPVEIAGMLTYLKNRSQGFDYLARPVVNEPKAESDTAQIDARAVRGKTLFEQRGCLACHTHSDFPGVKAYRTATDIVQGPDLTGLGSKFDPARNPKGADWLYSWIKQPSKYHARSVMPDLFLDPIPQRDADGNIVSTTDPAADIVAYLLQSTNPDWKPTGTAASGTGANLDRLVRENLEEAFFKETAAKYAQSGIPAALRNELKGPERELVVASDSGNRPLTDEQKLMYIGAKSISKYGCYGCHDIPGFEDAKPIGTGLADWGRKDPAKLAFEHITHYLDHHGGDHEQADHGDHADSPEATPSFYKDHISAGHREGFIWQKLTEPRSFDFMKTENKRYNEWLRMPKFPFNADEREAVITFVLGLVAEPPAPKYLYKPTGPAAALVEGRKVLDKFNCAGCHLMEPERWKVSVAEGEISPQPQPNLYPFLTPHFTPEEIQASTKTDSRGLFTTIFTGMPSIDDADARPKVNDEEGDPVDPDQPYDPAKVVYPFDLWKPTTLEGRVYRAGVVPVNVPGKRIDRRYPAEGGMLARYLLPSVTQQEKQVNPAAKGSESWAWVPPPLVGQGRKVQSQWFHDFLLNPYPIRPAVVLRMPKFAMTSAESTAIAKYFAAYDEVAYPVEPTERRLPGYLASLEKAYQDAAAKDAAASARLDDALKIVVNQNYCVKCHLVGDFEPKGADRAKAPNLAKIHDRLRPGYLREWIANPKQILPYTSMPLNVPYDPSDPKFQGGVDQKLYHGTSLEQIDGLVDLLMNFDNFTKSKTLITPLVPKEAPKPAATQETGDAKPAS